MTRRLIGMVDAEWAAFDGWAASQQVDPLALPYPRFLNLAYWWGVKDAGTPAAREKFDADLWRPPVGVAAEPGTPWSPEAETAGLAALAAAVGQVTDS